MNKTAELLLAAVADTAPIYAKVTAGDLDNKTPCDGWDLRMLLNHALSRFVISTRAARLGATDDFASVEIDYVGVEPARVFAEMSEEMVTAWSACEDFATDRVTPMGPIPAEAVLLFGAQDVFIHAWDVAKALKIEPTLSPELVGAFTETHRQSVDEQTRAMFFAEEIPVSDDSSDLDKLVAFLGRRP